MIASFVDELFSTIRDLAKIHNADAMLYDGRFDGLEPERIKVSKLIFFLDIEGVDLIQPKLNADEVDITELVLNVSVLAANRTIVYPSQEEPYLADVLVRFIYELKREVFFNAKLLRIGRIESAVKTDNYSVMRLSGLEFVINARHL
jgi:hypothetical protein